MSTNLAAIALALLPATWTPADLPSDTVADVAAHPRIGALAFASTSSGIYRSTDAGAHWQRVADAPGALHLKSVRRLIPKAGRLKG